MFKRLSLILVLVLVGCDSLYKIDWGTNKAVYVGEVKSVSYTMSGRYGDRALPIVQVDKRTFLLNFIGSAKAKDIQVDDKVWTKQDKIGTEYLLIQLEEDKDKNVLSIFMLD